MVGEFANMLLGRLRNSMLSLGADVATAIPSAVCGTDSRPRRTTDRHRRLERLRSDRGRSSSGFSAFRSDFRFGAVTEWSVRPNEADLVLSDTKVVTAMIRTVMVVDDSRPYASTRRAR